MTYPKTLSQRLAAAIRSQGMTPADLARKAGTTTATISNWLNDNVDEAHVKASLLFKIAHAAVIDPYELLTGKSPPILGVAEQPAFYDSHAVKLDEWKIAFQLVAEALDGRGLMLPPSKRAEVTLLAYDLLLEGMPEAKVLRFVLAAAA
jgi:transcriptional regulator with XRE-family HTH domain